MPNDLSLENNLVPTLAKYARKMKQSAAVAPGTVVASIRSSVIVTS